MTEGDRIGVRRRDFARRCGGLGASALLGPWAGGSAHAAIGQKSAEWPSQTLRVIVGFPVGSSPDMVARALAGPLARSLGQPVVVEDLAGEGGNLGANLVARATDGHTIGCVTNGPMTSSPHLYPNLPYRMGDFKPITLAATAPLVLICAKSINFATPQGFFAEAKASGDRWKFGSVGVGSATHLVMELLKSKVAGFNAVHVPFRGGPQAVSAMAAGQIQAAVMPLGSAIGPVKAGLVRAVGVTSAARSNMVPNLPSMVELGIPDVDAEVWCGFVMPAATPTAVASRLSAELSAIIRIPEMREKFYMHGWRAEGTSPDAMANRMRVDSQVYGSIIRMRGLRLLTKV